MMAEEKKSGTDRIGYGNPPKHTRFKSGQSGNPNGRPKDARRGPTDVAQILDEPVPVKRGGITRKILPFEASVRQLVVRAVKDKNVAAALEFVRLCEKYGLITPQPASQDHYVIIEPNAGGPAEWWQRYISQGLPPRPGARSGLPDSEEIAAHPTEKRDGR
jgi:hypothetical protein